MPYSTVDDLPQHIKKYGVKTARQWMHVFNTVYSTTNNEARAFRAANSTLKKRVNKDSYSQDYMNGLIDVWLGNLDG